MADLGQENIICTWLLELKTWAETLKHKVTSLNLESRKKHFFFPNNLIPFCKIKIYCSVVSHHHHSPFKLFIFRFRIIPGTYNWMILQWVCELIWISRDQSKVIMCFSHNHLHYLFINSLFLNLKIGPFLIFPIPYTYFQLIHFILDSDPKNDVPFPQT